MWKEAVAGAFVVASALPSMVDASRAAEIFSLLENGELQVEDIQFPDAGVIRNGVCLN